MYRSSFFNITNIFCNNCVKDDRNAYTGYQTISNQQNNPYRKTFIKDFLLFLLIDNNCI